LHRSSFEIARRTLGIGCAENSLAGDEDPGARGDDAWRGI
jgi:hypothetical protein